MYNISKSFDFCYGHSVWTQKLNTEFSIDGACVCRHQHGHQGQVIVNMTAESLDQSSMVTDFKHLNWFKQFLDDVLDHKMIIDINDPMLHLFYPLFQNLDSNSPESVDKHFKYHKEGYFTPWYNYSNYNRSLTAREIEIYEGLVIVPFCPTSEQLSKWLFDIVQTKMEGLATVKELTFKETPKTSATYTK